MKRCGGWRGGIEREQREWGAHDWLRLKLIKERKRRNGGQTILIIQTSPFPFDSISFHANKTHFMGKTCTSCGWRHIEKKTKAQ